MTQTADAPVTDAPDFIPAGGGESSAMPSFLPADQYIPTREEVTYQLDQEIPKLRDKFERSGPPTPAEAELTEGEKDAVSGMPADQAFKMLGLSRPGDAEAARKKRDADLVTMPVADKVTEYQNLREKYRATVESAAQKLLERGAAFSQPGDAGYEPNEDARALAQQRLYDLVNTSDPEGATKAGAMNLLKGISAGATKVKDPIADFFMSKDEAHQKIIEDQLDQAIDAVRRGEHPIASSVGYGLGKAISPEFLATAVATGTAGEGLGPLSRHALGVGGFTTQQTLEQAAEGQEPTPGKNLINMAIFSAAGGAGNKIAGGLSENMSPMAAALTKGTAAGIVGGGTNVALGTLDRGHLDPQAAIAEFITGGAQTIGMEIPGIREEMIAARDRIKTVDPNNSAIPKLDAEIARHVVTKETPPPTQAPSATPSDGGSAEPAGGTPGREQPVGGGANDAGGNAASGMGNRPGESQGPASAIAQGESDAVRQPSAEEVLPRQPGQARSAGSERVGVGRGEQGSEPAGTGGKEAVGRASQEPAPEPEKRKLDEAVRAPDFIPVGKEPEEGILSIRGASHAADQTSQEARADVRGLPPPPERSGGQSDAAGASHSGDSEPGVSVPWGDTTESRRSLLRASAESAARRFHGVKVGENADGLHYNLPDGTKVRHQFVDRIVAEEDELPAYFKSAIAANDGLQYFNEGGVDYKIPKTVEEWTRMRPKEKAAVLDAFRLHGKYEPANDTITTTHRAMHDHTIIAEEIFHAMAKRLKSINPELYDKMITESAGKKGARRFLGEDQAFHDYLAGRKLGTHAFKWMRRGTELPEPLTPQQRETRSKLAIERRKGNVAPEAPTKQQAAGERLLMAAQERGHMASDYEVEALLDNDSGIDPDHLDQYSEVDARGKHVLVPESERVENGGRANWRNWKLDKTGERIKGYVSEDNAVSEREADRIVEYLTTSRAEKYKMAAEHFHNEHEDPALQKDAETVLGRPIARSTPEASAEQTYSDEELPAVGESDGEVPFAVRREFSLSSPHTQTGIDFSAPEVAQAREREETKFEASAVDDVKPEPSLNQMKRLGVTDKNMKDAAAFTEKPTPPYARGVKTALLGRDLDTRGMSDTEKSDATKGFTDANDKMTEKQKDLALAIRRHENPVEDKTYGRIARKFKGGEEASGAMFAARRKAAGGEEEPEKVDPKMLTPEVLKRIDGALRRSGYDSRGPDDVREVLLTRFGGKLINADWKKAYNDAVAGKKVELNKPGEFSAIHEQAVKQFGTTTNYREAGYVLPDGRMLDFTGRRDATGYDKKTGRPLPGQPDYLRNERNVDHREIHRINPGGEDTSSDGTLSMLAFQKSGAARVDFASGLVDIVKPLSDRQLQTVARGLMADRDSEGHIDVDNGEGYTLAMADIEAPKLMSTVMEKLWEANRYASGEKEPPPGYRGKFAVRKRGEGEASDIPAQPEKPEDQDTRPDPTLFGQYDKGPTGIRNAIADIERSARNLPSAAEVVTRSYADHVLVDAREEYNGNPKAGEALVARIEADPSKPITDTDDAVLTMHQVALQNHFASNAAKLIEAKESGDPAAAERFRLERDRLSDELLRTYNADKKAGTANARGLAARRILMNEDYTYAGIETRIRAAKGGARMTQEETLRVKEMADKIKELQGKLDEFEKKRDAATRRAQRLAQAKALEADVSAHQPVGTVREKFTQRREAIKAGIREKLQRLRGAKFAARPEGEIAPPKIAGPAEGELPFDVSSIDGLGSDLRALERSFVEEGMTDREARVKAVHGEIKDLIPEMTERDVMDALSGYGKFKTPSKDAIDTELRQGHAWMQSAAKLLDVLQRIAPKRSGFQRGEPDDATRRLQQQVREKMKELGIETTDPATQLKTALQARKRGLRNSIADLEYQIAQRQKITRGKTPTPEDAETQDLVKRRDGLREQFDDIFGKPGKSYAELSKAAIRAAERETEDIERQMREKDIYAQKKGLPETPELTAARAKRDAAREQLQALKDADEGYQNMLKEKEDARKIAAMQEKITANAERIQKGNINGAAKKPGEAGSPEYQALVKQNDEMLATIDGMRREANPGKSPEEIALQARKSAMRNRMAELAERMVRGDFSPTQRTPVELDAEGKSLQVQLEQFKDASDRMEAKAREAAKPGWEKAIDLVPKWQRLAVLSGYHILAKLQAAALARTVSTPAEEVAGAGISKLLPKLSERAPRQGGASLEAEVKAITEGVVKKMPEAWRKLKTGKSDLDLLYGEKDYSTRNWMDFFGNLHGSLKEPVKQAEWARSFTKRQLAAARQGINVSDPAVMMKHGLEAYQDAQRAIFMQPNIVTKAYNASLAVLQSKIQKGGAAAVSAKLLHAALKSTFPIVHIPTNIVGEAGEYMFGTAIGSVRAGAAYARGIEKLPPEAADSIMRQLKKGSLGTAALAIGYFGASAIGGYMQKGQKRDDEDVPPGNVRIFGVNVPKLLLHHPLLLAVQVGATANRVMHSYTHGEQRGATEGGTAAMLGLVDDVPFVHESVDLGDLMDPAQRQNYLGRRAASMIVPGAIQQLARDTDAPTGKDVALNMTLGAGETNARKASGITENIEAGIPGARETLPSRVALRDSLKASMTSKMRSGDDVSDQIDAAIAAGKISVSDAFEVREAAQFRTDGDYKFHKGTAKEAIDALAAMSSMKRNTPIREGGESYLEVARAKIAKSNLPDAEKETLLAKWKKLGGKED